MKNLFQVSIAYLAASRGSEWKSKSYRVRARSVGEAERVGLNLLGREIHTSRLNDFAVFAKPFERQRQLERNLL